MTDYKEELIRGRKEYQERLLEVQIEQDEYFVNDLCSKIVHTYRNNYIRRNKEIVEVYICPSLNGGTWLDVDEHIKANFVYMSKTHNSQKPHYIPKHLVLALRYQLAKEYGLIFTEELSTMQVNCINTSKPPHRYKMTINKITIKLK
mgnify:CR=1 FL=1